MFYTLVLCNNIPLSKSKPYISQLKFVTFQLVVCVLVYVLKTNVVYYSIFNAIEILYLVRGGFRG